MLNSLKKSQRSFSILDGRTGLLYFPFTIYLMENLLASSAVWHD